MTLSILVFGGCDCRCSETLVQ